MLDIVAEMARKGLGIRTTWDCMVRPLVGLYLPLQVRITLQCSRLACVPVSSEIIALD